MLNIAVLEDNHALRQVLCDLLQAHGYDAWGAFDANELDERLAQRPIDLLLLDLCLPGEDGLSVARRLRQCMPGLFIIMTTAKSSVVDRVRGYEQGADVYLPKPVSEDELLATVSSVARRIDDLRRATRALAPSLHTVEQTLSGLEIVHLTRSETQLLKLLASARDQLAPTYLLLEALGKRVDDRSKASLEVQITYLRRKLEQACQGELRIRAVRGEGYQLIGRLQLRG